ncbi:cell division cycle 20-like protein B isoform D [Alligator mississippiensis]|uniref:Cell division cycle 20-like protein B isoform D n=1 Tax=Alligator mississippiensis TaxID=8496 RepID=A0A151MX83_ALLMI|nr:cell division cycle 20-like protein B isoform D [Alligator mississippiensis]
MPPSTMLCNTVDFGDGACPKDHSCVTRWEAAAHQSCSWDHPRALKRIPGISIGTTPDFGKTTYSRFKSSIVKKLTSSVPVASSPISTRWQQAHVRSEAEQTFTECRPINLSPSDGSELTRTPEEITKIPEPVINMNARYHKAYREDSQGRNKRPAESTNEQDIIHGHQDMIWQPFAMGHGFLPLYQQLALPHRVSYCTLYLSTVLDWATDFQVADGDEATQDTMDARVLWHHLQTMKH